MKVTEILFEKRYSGERAFIPLADIPPSFLIPENNIMIHVNEAFYTENNSSDGETIIIITRLREQTEEEKEEFRKQIKEQKAKSKEERRKQYLKLKEEFE